MANGHKVVSMPAPSPSLATHPPLEPGVELIAGHRYRTRGGRFITLRESIPDGWAGQNYGRDRHAEGGRDAPRWWYGAARRGRPAAWTLGSGAQYGAQGAVCDRDGEVIGFEDDLIEDVTAAVGVPGVDVIIGHRYHTRSGRIVETVPPVPEGDTWNGVPICYARDIETDLRSGWYLMAPTAGATGRGAVTVRGFGDQSDLVEDLTNARPFAVGDRVRAIRAIETYSDHEWAVGQTGVITHVPGLGDHGPYYAVRWDAGEGSHYRAERIHEVLVLVSSETHGASEVRNVLPGAVVPILAPLLPTLSLPRFEVKAFKALFGAEGSTKEHCAAWDTWRGTFSSPSPLGRALGLLDSGIEVNPASAQSLRLALRTFQCLRDDVRASWRRYARSRQTTREEKKESLHPLDDLRGRVRTADQYRDDGQYGVALRSMLRSAKPSAFAVLRILDTRMDELRTVRDTIVNLRCMRLRRTRIAVTNPGRAAGYFTAKCEEQRAQRNRALRHFLTSSGIASRVAEAMVTPMRHLIRLGNNAGNLSPASRADVIALHQDPAWRESILVAMRATYHSRFPRAARTPGVRRPRIPNDRGMAVALNEPLSLFVTDPRSAVGTRGWNGHTRPSRRRIAIGAAPGMAAEGTYEVQAIAGYHSVARRFTGGLDPAICGIEMETAFRRPTGEERGRVLAPLGWIVENDSSIVCREGEQSTEIVSPPRAWASIIATAQGWLEACMDGGWKLRGGAAAACGLHVTSSMPCVAADCFHSMLRRMHKAGFYQRFSGRTSGESLRYAHPEESGKYSPVNNRRGVGNLALIELRMFSGPTGDAKAYLMRIRMAELIFAISNLEDGAQLWASARAETDFLPKELPAEFATNYADTIAYWKARIQAAKAGSASLEEAA